MEATQGVPLAKCRVLERAGIVYEAFKCSSEAGIRDLAIMLRQVNRLFEHYIDVRNELWEAIEPVADSMSMRALPNESGDTVRLIARNWIPTLAHRSCERNRRLGIEAFLHRCVGRRESIQHDGT